MTLNTHSHLEENQQKKLKISADGIFEEKPDIIALQEVNQSIDEKEISCCDLHFTNKSDIIIKKDNYAYLIVEELKKKGVKYFWDWLPVKRGYERYDEGLAILSKNPIEKTAAYLISKTNDYNNWKKRMVLGAKVENEWFYCVHMGWFDDEEEPFVKQWENLTSQISNLEKVWLLGDFNADSKKTGQSYDLIKQSGWIDSFEVAKIKDSGVTVTKNIAGWENKKISQMRIDYIFSKHEIPIKESYTVFNGEKYPIVSDHFGVVILV